MKKTLHIDIWSDIACPWCYVGKRRLEGALARFPNRGSVAIQWRAFELDGGAPAERDRSVSYAARLAAKYGRSMTDAQAMLDRMTDVARADGLDFRFDRARSGNTFDAHRLIHLAHERGVQDAVKERFLRGYMTEGEPIGDPAALIRMATEAGLDEAEVRSVLAGDAHADAVRKDEEEAREIGISGVPFFVFGNKYAVSGAQSSDVLLGAIERAWTELEAAPLSYEEGAACGPDGCA